MTAAVGDIRLADLRYVTQAFIYEQPTTINLLPSRGTATQTATGGHDYTNPQLRPPQTVRISARSGGGGDVKSSIDAGKSVRFNYDLIAPYDATIEIGDTWDETAPDGTGIHYLVEYVEPSNGYEIIAFVVSWATEPQHGDA